MDPEMIHTVLQRAWDSLAALYGECDALSSESRVAIGHALGAVERAKALVRHDIDALGAPAPMPAPVGELGR